MVQQPLLVEALCVLKLGIWYADGLDVTCSNVPFRGSQ